MHATKNKTNASYIKQGQINGRTVADGCAEAVMQKPLAIQDVTDGWTDRLTNTARCRVVFENNNLPSFPLRYFYVVEIYTISFLFQRWKLMQVIGKNLHIKFISSW